jgi:uncharacterized sulfatase
MTEKGRHGDAGLVIGRNGLKPVYEFIEEAQKQNKPFFLWYAPMMPHTPHNPPPRLSKKYQAEGRDPKDAAYYAMCEWFDETCGELLDHLDKQKLAENTLVVYVTDNGWKQGAKNPMRDGKRSPYEGGIRTPIMLRWPGKIKPAMIDTPVMSIDLAPTILSACGLKTTKSMEGVNLLNVIDGTVTRDTIFGAAYQHDMPDWNKIPEGLLSRWTIEKGRWKLVVTKKEKRLELFDLIDDPHEKTDLAAKNPEIVQRLTKHLDGWWKIEE